MSTIYVEGLDGFFDLEVLAVDPNNCVNNLVYEGERLYQVQDAYFDDDEFGEACAYASGIDKGGNLYKIKWMVTNDEVEDGSERCDWNSYTVYKI